MLNLHVTGRSKNTTRQQILIVKKTVRKWLKNKTELTFAWFHKKGLTKPSWTRVIDGHKTKK